MAQFDPRRQPMRLAPHLFTAVAAVAVALLAGRFYQPVAVAEVPVMTAEEVAALEAQAFAGAGAPAGMEAPEAIPVQIRSGESFEQAVQRAGVGADEAKAVSSAIANIFDLSKITSGLKFETAISKPRIGRGDARLIGLTMRTGPASQLTVSRTFDGALKARALEETVFHETTVARGKVQGSLRASAAEQGANAKIINQMNKLFASKLDFQRDIKAGDEYVLVFERDVTESGRTIATGELLYAEIKGKVFYRYQAPGAKQAQYYDASGKNMRASIMRTPVAGARMSSSYGYRRHPISGYRKMHQGIDFAVPIGTPVIAAADGVVVEARRWGGYGNWVRIRHANGYESGYAHLSRYARGLRPGMRVSQGDVIAYAGSTGASTGPHLHYEIWRNGQRVNPSGVTLPQGDVLTGSALTAFRSEKSRIDAMIAAGSVRQRAAPQIAAAAPAAAALRPARS